jgi:hypothetical protein
MENENLRLGLSVILSRIKPKFVTLKYTDRSTWSFIGRHVPYNYFVNYSALKFKVMRTKLHNWKRNFCILVTEVLWIVEDRTYGHFTGGERPWGVYMITLLRRALLASVSYPSSGSANPTVTDHGGNSRTNGLVSWRVWFSSTKKWLLCISSCVHCLIIKTVIPGMN